MNREYHAQSRERADEEMHDQAHSESPDTHKQNNKVQQRRGSQRVSEPDIRAAMLSHSHHPRIALL